MRKLVSDSCSLIFFSCGSWCFFFSSLWSLFFKMMRWLMFGICVLSVTDTICVPRFLDCRYRSVIEKSRILNFSIYVYELSPKTIPNLRDHKLLMDVPHPKKFFWREPKDLLFQSIFMSPHYFDNILFF